MGLRLSVEELHTTLLRALDPFVEEHSSITTKPLFVKLSAPLNISLQVYLYNCTNPPGARQAGEYKSQIILPGQKRGQRGIIPEFSGAVTLLMGFASIVDDVKDGMFVIWELTMHKNSAYSANIQVSLSTLAKVYETPMFAMKKRGNGEWVVVCRPQFLLDGIKKRIDIDINLLIED